MGKIVSTFEIVEGGVYFPNIGKHMLDLSGDFPLLPLLRIDKSGNAFCVFSFSFVNLPREERGELSSPKGREESSYIEGLGRKTVPT